MAGYSQLWIYANVHVDGRFEIAIEDIGPSLSDPQREWTDYLAA